MATLAAAVAAHAASAQMTPGAGMGGAGMLHGPWPMIAIVIALIAVVALALGWFFSRPVDVSGLGVPAPPEGRGAAPDPAPAPVSQDAARDTFVVIPDISGYTRYMRMTRFAAGHAQFVISRLLEAVLGAGQPPLSATRVEGDSVVFCAASGDARGDVTAGSAAGAVRRIVEAFYRERAALASSNACPCDACHVIAELELKVIVHRGDVLRYRLGGMQDLSGLAVIEAHRLLKNSLGRRRYVLVTEAARDVVLDWPTLGHGHVEHYDDLGDMHATVYLPPEPDDDAGTRRAGERARDLAGKLASNARSVTARPGGGAPPDGGDRLPGRLDGAARTRRSSHAAESGGPRDGAR